MILRSLLFLSLLLSPIAQARMYQWVDPDSGTTQLSGTPPTWYRSAERGPRIFVIEKGQIIDDTAIKISDEQRDILRQRAFIKVEDDRTIATQKALEAEKLKAALTIESDEKTTMEQQVVDTPEEVVEEADIVAAEVDETTESKKDAEELTAEEMRAKIKDWENERTEEAKKLLDSGT
jgi:ABC-type methionine transport system ATPase subunit